MCDGKLTESQVRGTVHFWIFGGPGRGGGRGAGEGGGHEYHVLSRALLWGWCWMFGTIRRRSVSCDRDV